MTRLEQQEIINALGAFDEQACVAFGKRMEEWAEITFGKDGQKLRLEKRGIRVQYRVAAIEDWLHLDYIYFTQFSWETNDDRRRREQSVNSLFYWKNEECSNQMGDVLAVRYIPFIDVNGEYRYKEDETKLFKCTDTGERRRWNHLDIRVYDTPSSGKHDYYLVKQDIRKGDNICWFEPWHFSLGDDAPCPVGPIIVEEVDDYSLVLRYHDKLFTLSMELDKSHNVTLDADVQVEPTHNWDSMWLRPPFKFDLVAELTWKQKLYGSSDRDRLRQKPNYVRTSDLPANVRTREQIDHDAWEEAVQTGAINHHTYY